MRAAWLGKWSRIKSQKEGWECTARGLEVELGVSGISWMLCWQQNQREGLQGCVLGQAVLDEQRGIIPPLSATLGGSRAHSGLPSGIFGRRESSAQFWWAELLLQSRSCCCLWDPRCWWPWRFLCVLNRARLLPPPYSSSSSRDMHLKILWVHLANEGKVKPWNGHNQVLTWWGIEKRLQRDLLCQGLHTALLYSNLSTPHPQQILSWMCFPTALSCILFTELSNGQGWGKNIDYKRHSKEINQTLLLQQSTLQGWQRAPAFQLV